MFRKLLYSVLVLLFLGSTAQAQKYDFVEILTPKGSIWLYLYDATPQHKANFLKLAKEGYFDGTTFHRVIKDFMIQGGDPNSKDDNPSNDGAGGPEYRIPAEINDSIKHILGAVGAARDDNPEKSSSGSQFYVVNKAGGTPFLDKNYTVFGETIYGIGVVESIALVPKNGQDRPNTNVPMQVRIHKLSAKKLKKVYGIDFKPAQLQAR